MSSFTTRRRFLRNTLAISASPIAFPHIARSASPNSKLQYASIGVAGMQGGSDLDNIASHPRVEVVALCDIDAGHLAQAAQKFPNARRYTDWREMLDAEGDKVDAVNVTIPDHMHAPVSYTAMQKGKHVYCQKPLTHDVFEARQLRLAAEKAGVVTQMGNQIQSAIEYRSAVALIQAGVIGKVSEIHAWCSAVYTGSGRPAKPDPVPDGLSWEKWLGSAPERPYAGGVYHPVQWRCWQDFGGGCMGDFGCHILDTPFKACELTQPISVKALAVNPEWADSEAARSENWPAWEVIEFVLPGTRFTAGDRLKITWYDGVKQPPADLFPFGDDEEKSIPGSGALFIGEGGVLLLPHVGGPRLLPRERNRGIERPKLEPRNHYHHWVDACLGGEEPTSNFTYAGNLAEAVLLGTVACRFPGQELAWDAAGLRVTNVEAANRFLRRTYRDGWSVPGLG